MNCTLVNKIKSESEWRAEHQQHGEPEKVYPKQQPPAGTYKIVHLCCPCGAVNVGIEA